MQYSGELSPDRGRRGLKIHFGKKGKSSWKKIEIFLEARKIKKAPVPAQADQELSC